MKQPKNR